MWRRPIFAKKSWWVRRPRKVPKLPRNEVFRVLTKIESIQICFSNLNMKLLMVFSFSAQATWLGKTWFLIYDRKASRIIRIQNSLNHNISEASWGMKLNFCMWWDIHSSNIFIQSWQVSVVRHARACSKLGQIVSQLHLKNELNR